MKLNQVCDDFGSLFSAQDFSGIIHRDDFNINHAHTNARLSEMLRISYYLVLC